MKLLTYSKRTEECTGTQYEALVAESEEMLIREIKMISNNVNRTKLKGYYKIGEKIISFYGEERELKDYGKDVIGKIAGEIGINNSTLYKIIQMTKKINSEDIDEFCEGGFHLSWCRLRDTLSLDRNTIIRAYNASANPKEFTRKINQSKKLKIVKDDKKNESNSADENCPGRTNFKIKSSDENDLIGSIKQRLIEMQKELEWKEKIIKKLQTELKENEDVLNRFIKHLPKLDSYDLSKIDQEVFMEKKRRATKIQSCC